MASEEDLLDDAYYKEDGDLEELDEDAEDALLGDSDEESQAFLKDSGKNEVVEYIDEEGNIVEIGENDEVEFVEDEESGDNFDYAEAVTDDPDDVLDLAVDPDLEFDDSATVVDDNTDSERKFKLRSSSRNDIHPEMTSQIDDTVTKLSYGERNFKRDSLKRGSEGCSQSQISELTGDSSESDNEDSSGRGRFHSERSNIINLSAAKKRSNIPDSLDDILQNESNRSDRNKQRKTRDRSRPAARSRSKDRDRNSKSFRRSSSLSPKRSQSKTTSTSSSSQSNKRKILINPHFMGKLTGSSVSSSTHSGSDYNESSGDRLYTRDPNSYDVMSSVVRHPSSSTNANNTHLLPLPGPPPPPVISAARPLLSFDPLQPPPRVTVAPPCTSVPPPPLHAFCSRLPPPALPLPLISSNGGVTNLAVVTAFPQPTSNNVTQSWTQFSQPLVSVQAVQDNNNTVSWGNQQQPPRLFNTALTPQPQRWPNPLPSVVTPAPNRMLFPVMPVGLSSPGMPDIRRPPPPRHPGHFLQPPPPLPAFNSSTSSCYQLDASMRFNRPPPVFGNVQQKSLMIQSGNRISPALVEQKQFKLNTFNQSRSQHSFTGPNMIQRFRLPQQQQGLQSLAQVRFVHPSVPVILTNKRLLHGSNQPAKVLKLFDKQGIRRKPFQVNSNIKEVPLVDTLPAVVTEPKNASDTSSLVNSEEDEETRRYREQIEMQKKKREEIMRLKEQRRRIMAVQRRKQMIAQQQQQLHFKLNDGSLNVATVLPVQHKVVSANNTANKIIFRTQTNTEQQQQVGSASVLKKRVVIRKVMPMTTGSNPVVALPGGEQTPAQTRPLGRATPMQAKSSNANLSTGIQGEKKVGQIQQRIVTAVRRNIQVATSRSQNVTSVMENTAVATSSMQSPTKAVNTVLTSPRSLTAKMGIQQSTTPEKPRPNRTVILHSAKTLPTDGSSKLQQLVLPVQGKQQLPHRLVVTKNNSTNVLIENLALSTSEAQVRKLCQTVGLVENVKLNRDQRKAIVTFKTQKDALDFMDRYQRKMMDLSLITISMMK